MLGAAGVAAIGSRKRPWAYSRTQRYRAPTVSQRSPPLNLLRVSCFSCPVRLCSVLLQGGVFYYRAFSRAHGTPACSLPANGICVRVLKAATTRSRAKRSEVHHSPGQGPRKCYSNVGGLSAYAVHAAVAPGRLCSEQEIESAKKPSRTKSDDGHEQCFC